MSKDLGGVTEAVARAICWEANGKDHDCNTACMSANKCTGPLNDCFVRDANAAIAAYQAAAPVAVADGERVERTLSDGRVQNPWPPFTDENGHWNAGFSSAWGIIRAALNSEAAASDKGDTP